MPDEPGAPTDAFPTDGEADAYAMTFYADPSDPGTQILLAELAKSICTVGAEVLDYGCGPTAYVPLLAAPFVATIEMWDPSPQARAYVRRWAQGADDALWAPYADFIAGLQGVGATPAEVMAAARSRTRVLDACPLPERARGFNAVVANFSLEAEAKSVDEWILENAEVASLAVEGGLFFATYLLGARTWRVQEGGPLVEATTLSEKDMAKLVSVLRLDEPTVTIVPLDRELYEGFAIVTGRVPHVRA